MSTETICRRINGTIDTDFYRTRALRERRAARTAGMRQLGRGVHACIALLAECFTTPAGRPMPDPGAVMLIAQAAVRHPKI